MIYLDNAATTLRKPPQVAAAVMAAISGFGNSGRGVHGAALDAARTILEARQKLTALFGGNNPENLVFTMNATQALNTALKGLLNPGDHVITTVLEHNSVLRPLYELEAQGVQLSFISCDEKGNVDPEDFEKEIQDNTKLIVCTHGSNLTGNVVDIEAVGTIAQRHKLLFVVDAAQTAGVIPIDVEKMHIDVLCFTGHKGLMGPQGTGGMYVRPGVNIRPLLTGGSGVHSYDRHHPSMMPTTLEAGTLNAHGIAGLLAATEFLQEAGVEQVNRRERELLQRLYRGIRNVPGVKILGDPDGKNHTGVLTINIWDYDSAQVSDVLMERYGICTRPGAHCAPKMHEALQTVQQGAVRFSLGYYNTEEEIDAAIEAVHAIADLTE